jgi:hypothetical protein
MQLDREECARFYKLNFSLLAYVGRKRNIGQPTGTSLDFAGLPLAKKTEIRDSLYQHIDLVDSFARENPFNFDRDDLQIVSGWRHFVKGRFVVMKYLRKYAAFLSTDKPAKVYGVLALTDPFEEMLGPLPFMIETVLLPFEGKIIYDGLMTRYSLSFGPGMRRELNEAYDKARSAYGVITSLPASEEQAEPDRETLLRYYLKNERNRELYSDEIGRLVNENDRLLGVYHEEMGKAYARIAGRRLKALGVKDAWFAILEGLIVAAGASKAECGEIADKVLPPEKARFVYYHRVKG